ncbi:MAG: glycosyltransferase [Anaerolineae bacterium]|jgi:trehalose synthase|nr:glycosyltransferase [Anaerolineae bacterium]MDH7472995.1 glycosyltransferase [Anaerolineae bacterium]
MLTTVELQPKSLADYAPIVGDEIVEQIRALAEPLKGARVVHINATAFGGGVAEILYTLVPLMRDVGLEAEWQVIEGRDEFFNVTKACHNGLQGMDIPFTDEMRNTWQRYNEMNAARFEGEYDFVIIHDPQPAGLLHYHGRAGGKHWVWRCHIDTSHPNPVYWDFFAPYISEYEAGIFTMEQYVGPGVNFKHLAIIAPTIDPLSPKNVPQTLEESRAIVRGYGIDLHRPLLTQVSRYDPWKDPLGVIDAYRLVKREMPVVQLALLGSMASDDPEGWTYYDRTVRHAGEDFDIYILHNFHGVGNREVNAFQNVSDVVIQKSTREGFGLVVTEALWKGKPVVGGNVGGIPLQVLDGETGFLVDSVEACAEKTLYLLQHPDEAERMGARGREHVRQNFLSTRHLRDYLRLFASLS